MKTTFLLLFLSFFQIIGISIVNGQTLTLQPGPADGMDTRLCSVAGYSSSSSPELPIAAWTYQGTPGIDHSFIYFDLSSIPAGSSVTDAQLFLYGATDLGSGGHSTLSGSNEWLIQRVVSSWNLSTTWATSPTATTSNQVSMPASTTSDQNFQANVTDLVQDMVDNPQSSFGFMMKLQTESHYRRLNFASRNYPTASKRPKLVITYTSTAGIQEEYESELSVYPNPTDKGGVYIRSNSDDSNSMVELYSLLGEKVYEGNLYGKDTFVDLSFLEKGIYHLKVYTNNKTIIKKVEIL
ncbi:MAG: hypothetical protein K0S23_3460 [Fluviicola sp.]|jgi:hypothetical protein|uniref:DNRLRE domain-containing protein n=1 Tax=Fluviicola sp. TaxID=1917219 RepID=UPI00262A52C4|nr:DNRLRE domain-containing protein [Fluviicola sp.]MDF3029153.1 hypothetical protein [Fluviicola sp.]